MASKWLFEDGCWSEGGKGGERDYKEAKDNFWR